MLFSFVRCSKAVGLLHVGVAVAFFSVALSLAVQPVFAADDNAVYPMCVNNFIVPTALNCDNSQINCTTANTKPALPWTSSGYAGGAGNKSCCGDDSQENYVTQVCPGVTGFPNACCPNATDKVGPGGTCVATCPDAVSPTVVTFDVVPRTTSGPVTISWHVTDQGGSHLKEVIGYVARYDNQNQATLCNEQDQGGCVWTQLTPVPAPANSDDWSGQTTHTPTVTSLYGLHVKDNANNEAVEPSIPGPIKVDVITAVSITATDATAAESGNPANNPGVFTITRTGATTNALTVNLTTSGSAAVGSDYTHTMSSTPNGLQVTIPIGAASQAVTIAPVDDSTIETDETVILTISVSGSYTLGSPSSATIIIADNDSSPALPSVVITSADPNAAEPTDPGTFTVTRTGATTNSLTVNLSTSGSTASIGTDYTHTMSSTPGGLQIIIGAGSASQTITITPIDDTSVEGNETVVVTIGVSSAYTRGSPSSATVTIVDNESIPSTCSDGTQYGSCSTTKPKFCSNGTLIDRASQCGCPTGQTPQGESCVSSSSCTANVATGATVTVKAMTTDPDNDPIFYTITWGDGATSRVPGSGTVASGFAATQTHVYNAPNTFTVTATATDVNGNVSPASDPLTMCVTGTPQCTQGGSCSNTLQGQTCPGTYNATCACIDTQDSCPSLQSALGDLTCDTIVDVRDLGVLFHFWGKAATVISACGTPLSSLAIGSNTNGIVDDGDFAVLMTYWN